MVEGKVYSKSSRVRGLIEYTRNRMRQLDEIKVLRDPIHGYIHIELGVIWDLVNSPEMQRLRRIHQLGATYQVYHTAEHSRFAHSLGVYEIVRRMVRENDDIAKALNDWEKMVVMVAALLHDIGHGPFSHTFEHVSHYSHEDYTCNIITSNSHVYDILSAIDVNLPKEVASVITHTHPKMLMSQMVSSQLDADRMDYLLRDAFFTGTRYGEYDLERVLRTLRVRNGRLVVKESGIHTIEDYIMARYHMYWQVYYHPVGRSFEAVLHNVFERLRYVYQNDPDDVKHLKMFLPLMEHHVLSNHELQNLDESACQYGFVLMSSCQDAILRDLSMRILNRRLFDYDDINTIEQENQYYQWILSSGYDPDYYMCVDRMEQRPYEPYKGNEENEIWVLMRDGHLQRLSTASNIVEAILAGQSKSEKKVFYPKELNE